MDNDYVEIGDGLIAVEDGWWLDTTTGYKISPDGVVMNGNEVIYDPLLEDEYGFMDDE